MKTRIAPFVLAVAALATAGTSHAATLTKAFGAAAIAAGANVTLTFTVNNPAGQPARADVGFTDTLPAGIVVAPTPNVGGTCANAAAATTATAGSGTITVTSLQVPAGASSCTVTVDVTNAANQFNASCAGNPAAFTNAAGNISNLGTDTNGVQPSCLVVNPLTVAKAFAPTTIASGGTTTLTFTATNPAGAPAISNVGIVDSLPAGIVVAPAPNVGGTCANAAAATTATAGSGTITVTSLQVPAGASSCTVTVDVTNAPGQFNASCVANPSAFTNDAANVALSGAVGAFQPSCIVVTGGPVVAVPGVPVPTLRHEWLALLALLVAALAMTRR
ncbi:MAG TPA: hypothetical protein VII68_13090 [Casimicrobiaceae bacterium]|jgi:uncharacterized repeat protein (TIGR01451 family)